MEVDVEWRLMLSGGCFCVLDGRELLFFKILGRVLY